MSQHLTEHNATTPPPFVPVTFETFGKYILLRKIETGGMAEVFLARPATVDGNGRVAVIKRILPHMAEDPSFVKMFRAEVQVMMGFNHPHLIQLHDFGAVGGRTYIAMEYIEGKTLKKIISTFREKKELIPTPMALSLIAQAASGLSYAHNFENPVTGEVFNAIHRDISPQNLILSYDGNLKVIDFGIAKAVGGTAEHTEAGIIKGKISYLSPEQIQGRELDGRSDIFSLGIVAWEILTSKRPFTDDLNNEMKIMKKIQRCDQIILPPSTHNKEIPPAVDAVVMKALRQEPDDRYASAHAFQTAIRQVMRQHYPTYCYADTGELMRVLFEKEITQERSELRAFNENAQKFLMPNSPSPKDATSITNTNSITSESVLPVSTKPLSTKKKGNAPRIESPSAQKSSLRHYALFAVYFLSLVALKLDDRYGLLVHIFGRPQQTAPASLVVAGPIEPAPPTAALPPLPVPASTSLSPAAAAVARAVASVPTPSALTAKMAAPRTKTQRVTRQLKRRRLQKSS